MPLEISKIRALCFDVDGTLSDTDDRWVQQVERLLRPVRWFFPGRQVQPFARWLVMGLETPGNFSYYLLDRLGLDDEAARIFGLFTKLRARRPKSHWLLIRGIKEMLQVVQRVYPLAIVSARGERGILEFLNQFELRPFFSSVITAQTCEHTKPFPDPILRAAQEMGVSPQECVMIGDTPVDIRAGKAAGAQTVGVLCGFGREQELHRAGADLILPSTADLAETLLLSNKIQF